MSSSLQDLPNDVLTLTLGHLPDHSLVAIGCTCKNLKRLAGDQSLWKRLCQARWRIATPLYQTYSSNGLWKEIYKEKSQIDSKAVALFKEMLENVSDADIFTISETSNQMRYLHELGEDAHEIVVKVIMDHTRHQPTLDSGAALRVCMHRSCQVNLAYNNMLSASARSEIIKVEDGSLKIAEIFHPFAHFAPIFEWFDGMAEECLARMKRADVNGGAPALRILSQLLFAPTWREGEEEQEPFDPIGLQMEDHVVNLDFLTIPKQSADSNNEPPPSFGLRGNTSDFERLANSLIPDVLQNKRGLPITLCIIYQAIARRVGLTVNGICSPGHYFNHWTEGDEEYFIDCFDEGRLMSRSEIVAGFLGGNPVSDEEQPQIHFIETFLHEFLRPATFSTITGRVISNIMRHKEGGLKRGYKWFEGERINDITDAFLTEMLKNAKYIASHTSSSLRLL